MEKSEKSAEAQSTPSETAAELLKQQLEAEKRISDNVMSIRLTSDGLIIKDKDEPGDNCKKLPGVYCQGIQYYDLNGVNYISNHGLAILIDLMKNLLEIGVEVQFVNVDDRIKARIRQMGLESIINCNQKDQH